MRIVLRLQRHTGSAFITALKPSQGKIITNRKQVTCSLVTPKEKVCLKSRSDLDLLIFFYI